MTTYYDFKNVFAKILRGEIPCQKIYEDEFCLAFHDISPIAPTHALIIPKSAYINMYDFNEKANAVEIVGFYKGINKVIKLLNLNENGFRVVSNCGSHGEQAVPHYHLHILGGRPLGAIAG